MSDAIVNQNVVKFDPPPRDPRDHPVLACPVQPAHDFSERPQADAAPEGGPSLGRLHFDNEQLQTLEVGDAVDRLIDTYGLARVVRVVKFAAQVRGEVW